MHIGLTLGLESAKASIIKVDLDSQMDMHAAKTRSMRLLRVACDAGASAEAMNIIQANAGGDTERMVPWPRVVTQLEALLAAHRLDANGASD